MIRLIRVLFLSNPCTINFYLILCANWLKLIKLNRGKIMGAKTYLEKDFEGHIEESLLKSGYHKGHSDDFDPELCLLPKDFIAFIKDSQPEEYEKLMIQYGDQTDRNLCHRLQHEISQKGTLKVLRKGITDRSARFKCVYSKPSSGMNPDHLKLYQKNRLTVVRQLKYSKRHQNTIDLTLFLNGIPIVTAELKNLITGQSVQDAVKQYRETRDPRDTLLQFKRCLVHFAVGIDQVFMTTQLEKEKSFFLPFNRDTENPMNPKGLQSAYLWEERWSPDSLLDIIGNYLHLQETHQKIYDSSTQKIIDQKKETMIFPRFHQRDAVETLIDTVKKEGVGHHYLVQHSAGSGKSNTIAWLAHKLASLYQSEKDTQRLFDTIIVITDRKILDTQLQKTIKQFEQTQGVVQPIDKTSAQLKSSLESGKDIIITTIQKFPMISDAMNGLNGQRFAVIIDEAHSSQSGETSKHLKKVLSTSLEEAEKDDKDDFDVEDEIIKEIRSRGFQKNISYFAFTATPKNKTLELFGRQGEDGKHKAFHLYTMRQAIEEGFILDVLKNYITFKRYFTLIKTIDEDKEFEKSKAMRLLTNYVDLQDHAIDTKSQIMLDHFLDHTVNAIQGLGRAMVVTRSRLHAVKYYLSFKKKMSKMNLSFKPLVAFSSEVDDPDVPDLKYTENSLNQLQGRVSIQDAYKTPEYRLLIVASKFQTGFDEPLLHTMYVDKRLGGVNAVQTLSRLNRIRKGKTDTVVLDFVNEAEDIVNSFQPYYQTSSLSEETDPNKLYDIKDRLEDFEIFSPKDVQSYAQIFFNPEVSFEKLDPIINNMIITFKQREEEEREDFRSVTQSYIRLYGFISQLISFEDIYLEQLYVFLRHLNKKLPKRDSQLPVEVEDAVDLDSFRIQETFKGSLSLTRENGELVGITSDQREFKEEEKSALSQIIDLLNETYGTDLTEEDQKDLENIHSEIQESKELREFANPQNTKENVQVKFNKELDTRILSFIQSKLKLYQKLSKPEVNATLKTMWFAQYYQAQLQERRRHEEMNQRLEQIEQRSEKQFQTLTEKMDKMLDTISNLQSNITDVKSSTQPDEEKIKEINTQVNKKFKVIRVKNLLKPYIDHLKKEIRYWDKLGLLSQESLSQGDFLLEQFKKIKDGDYSPVILQYCMALENEMLNKIFIPFTSQFYEEHPNLEEVLLNDFSHPKSGKFAKDLKRYRNEKPEGRTFTLGDMEWSLNLTAGKNTIKESPLVQELKRFVDGRFNSGFPSSDFKKGLQELVKQFRNKAAHPYKLSEEKALECKRRILSQINEFTQALIH